MRKRSGRALLTLLGAMSAALPTLAQKPAPQLEVTVVVENALPQPPQPVKAVRVSLSYLDSSVLVTEAQQVTNSQGQALLVVSADAAQRGDLRIAIAGAGDLVIYQPADGQLPALAAKLTISLLPKGTASLLQQPGLAEALMRRMSLEITSQKKTITALQGQVNAMKSQKPDLGAVIAEWAEANGFSSAQASEMVQQWAADIERKGGGATKEEQGLAELALKHYDSAAQLFSQAGDADQQEIDAEDSQQQALEEQVKALQAAQQALLDKERISLRQLLDRRLQTAGAEQLNLEYHEATQTMASAAATADAEYKKHSGDREFHELWLEALEDAAVVQAQEGEIASGDQSLPLLAQAADEFQSLASAYADLGDREDAADAQCNFAVALAQEAERTTGDKAMTLLNQAAQAYKNALGFYSKTTAPEDWAIAQSNLSVALMEEGVRVSGDQAMPLFDQAVEADRDALQVVSKADMPQVWAQSQANLGNALLNDGERVDADKAVPLLNQAVQAFKDALQVLTRADQPREWAQTQNTLAMTLTNLGMRTSRDQAMAFFDQAVEAFQQALQVRSKDNLPQDWAQTQVSLASALMAESTLALGSDKATALLDQAVAALRNGLEVYTSNDLTQPWAATQLLLGNALFVQAASASGEKAIALLDQAAQAYRNALQVFRSNNMAQPWATTQMSLAYTLTSEAERSSGDKAGALLDQAAQAYRDVLQVFTKTDLPQQWAATQLGLATALMLDGELAEADKAKPLFDQSAQAYQNALQVFTKPGMPQLWEQAQMGMVMLSLVSGNFSQCLQQDAMLTDDAVTPYQALVRDALKLACAWGANDKTTAVATAKMLLAKPPLSQVTFTDMNPAGYFLSQSPAFAATRASWIALFTAVQGGDSAGISAALKQLEPILQQ